MPLKNSIMKHTMKHSIKKNKTKKRGGKCSMVFKKKINKTAMVNNVSTLVNNMDKESIELITVLLGKGSESIKALMKTSDTKTKEEEEKFNSELIRACKSIKDPTKLTNKYIDERLKQIDRMSLLLLTELQKGAVKRELELMKKIVNSSSEYVQVVQGTLVAKEIPQGNVPVVQGRLV